MVSSSWQENEQRVREYLEYLFSQKFTKRKLPVTLPGKPTIMKEFDAVSEDRKIIAQVKAYRAGHATEDDNVLLDALYLQFCSEPVNRAMLFITDHLYYQLIWRRKSAELLGFRKCGIEFVSPKEFQAFCERKGIAR